jgi:N-acetylglucosaminyl-diphospho-decaprenol L-rhamnosyltransferase
MTELTLILVNYHSAEPLERFFDSLERHPVSAAHEILVLDNAPGDGVAERLAARAPQARVISMGRNVGYARAVNAGIAAASGRAFLVINPDVELSEGGVDSALAYLNAHPEVGLLGARLLNADGSVQRSARRFYTLTTILLRRTPLGRLWPAHPALRAHLMLDDDLDAPRPVDWVMGAWMMARRDAVERVGPMDGRFFLYFEDVDWCYRMWAAGYEVHYFPSAAFVHQYRRSSGRVGKTLLYHLRSFLSFYDKWGALVYVTKHLRPGWETLTAVVADILLLNASFLGAFYARRAVDPLFPEPLFDLADYVPLLLFTNLVALVTLPLLGRYRQRGAARRMTQWLTAGRTALLVTLLVMSGTFVSHTRTFSRAVILLLFPVYTLGLQLARLLRERVLGGAGGAPGVTRALLLGSPVRAAQLARTLAQSSGSGLVVAGAVTTDGDVPAGLRRLGAVEEAGEIAERYRAGEVLVDAQDAPHERMEAAVRELAAGGAVVLLQQPWAAAAAGPDTARRRHGLTWWSVRPPAACGEGAWLKALLDRPLGALLCLLSLPGFVVCCTLGWPLRLVALGAQQRLGHRRQRLRWRELVLRRSGAPLWGIVQLPLFVQVLAGRLSLVGPCPLPAGVEEELGPIQLLRFAVKPGLTGFWQQAPRGAALGQLIADDLEYLERWSLTLDLDLFLSGFWRLMGSRDRWHPVPVSTRARS